MELPDANTSTLPSNRPACASDIAPGEPFGPWSAASDKQWSDWKWQQSQRIRTLAQLEQIIELSEAEKHAFRGSHEKFRVSITPYYASLMDKRDPECPVRRQAVPGPGELEVSPHELRDPLAEEAHMVAPGVTHRYPDRVLFYVSHNCPVYCRHCTRKRKVADPHTAASLNEITAGLDYIRETEAVRDVLVSGGDPLTLSDDRLGWLLNELAAIDHVDIIRLGTRNPVTLPQRITPALCDILRGVRSLYVHTHFNHPKECTPHAASALEQLADAGCVLGNQMVLLRGINDQLETVEALNRWLVRHRCRPYYIFQADMAEGISHFRTPLQTGIDIIDGLRGHVSGPAIPHFALDLPGGGGKITLTPEYLVSRAGNHYTFRNGAGEHYEFVDIAAEFEDRAALQGKKHEPI